MTLPIVVPLSLASTAFGASVQTTVPTVPAPTVQLVALTPTIVETETPQLTIEVTTTSPYLEQQKAQAAAEAAKKQAAAQAQKAVAVTVTASPDPGYDAKLRVAQSAAATFGIDWRVLAAVWQVESGTQWQTAERNRSGATGPCQFLPSTWHHYAFDGNGDGVKSIASAQDCLYGAAKLLASNGAASGDVTRALLSYNHSLAYVQKVLRIANSLS